MNEGVTKTISFNLHQLQLQLQPQERRMVMKFCLEFTATTRCQGSVQIGDHIIGLLILSGSNRLV